MLFRLWLRLTLLQFPALKCMLPNAFWGKLQWLQKHFHYASMNSFIWCTSHQNIWFYTIKKKQVFSKIRNYINNETTPFHYAGNITPPQSPLCFPLFRNMCICRGFCGGNLFALCKNIKNKEKHAACFPTECWCQMLFLKANVVCDY